MGQTLVIRRFIRDQETKASGSGAVPPRLPCHRSSRRPPRPAVAWPGRGKKMSRSWVRWWTNYHLLDAVKTTYSKAELPANTRGESILHVPITDRGPDKKLHRAHKFIQNKSLGQDLNLRDFLYANTLMLENILCADWTWPGPERPWRTQSNYPFYC